MTMNRILLIDFLNFYYFVVFIAILCIPLVFFFYWVIFPLTTMWSDSIEDDSSGTETQDSSEFDSEDEYEDGFIDDSDLGMYPPSQVPNSGGSLTFLKDC